LSSASPKTNQTTQQQEIKALVSVDLNRSGEKPENQNQKTTISVAAGERIQKHSHLAASEKRDGDGSKTKRVETNQTTTEAVPHHINVDETQSANAADTTAERCGWIKTPITDGVG
jgi:hypothetical protein